ncbi:MAG: biopolymer transporter ExbD [Gemmatimonadota bacterium]|nr:MAG: biopolymer transporter ExbD [Gemmatimonadota bacterium]
MPQSGLRGRGELPLEGGINVTSLVDVAFVLLIIFMITAPIMQGGVDIELPRGEPRPIEPREGLIITVNSEGQIFIDDEATPLPYEEFRVAFGPLVSRRQPSGVYLRGDRRTAYGTVVRVLAVMQTAGVDNVALVLEEEEIER